MTLTALKPRQALNKAFLKVKPNRNEIESFKTHLITLLDRINDKESEEFHKNLVSDFLKDTYYKQNHFINTKGRNDLVIHNGSQANTSVGVIIEAKKPTNKAEMITTQKLNAKAFQELVLYYLRERITHKNLEVKHLVATNIYEWFVFDATLFDRLFAQNKNLVNQFNDFEAGRLADTKTDFFYKQIAEPFIEQLSDEIPFTYFNLQDFQEPLRNADKADDTALIALFKLLSPEHLLKLPFANDSNSLDKRFYSELLHLIGLTETKEGGKKLIQRHPANERHSGSLLEDAIIQLDSLDKISRLEKPNQFGNTEEERLFNVALELSITWVNRILFLKLLEAQLITYHKSPLLRGAGGVSEYKFLNPDKIKNYDDLNSLFFQVLARKVDERNADVKQLFEKVPYLNSSLFEPTGLEHNTLFISNLKDDKQMPIFAQTVLKDQQGKKRTGTMTTLQYLFAFLDAYDFGAEGGAAIQEDNKTLINASVLGLIFEKINGYKDGSFFTPGFITMYMCRETIRKAVVQKFNEAATKSPLLRGNLAKSSLEEEQAASKDNIKSPLLRGAGGVSEGVSETMPKKRQIIPYNPNLKELARQLRNNSTKSEIILWKELKGKLDGKYDFHRQKPLDNYIADFFCHELQLVIELDGETHNWEETQQKDFEKESRFNELGLNVLRFPDTDIFKHLEATLATIQLYVSGFEKGDLSELVYEDSPLNPLTGNVAIIDKLSNTTQPEISNTTHPRPLSRGEDVGKFLSRGEDVGKFLSRGEDVGKFLSGGYFETLDDVYEQIGEDRLFTRQEANNIVNSIKICDPAVGSGHFLVSALNEMIAVKNDLKILQDRDSKRLKEYQVEVVNDELIVTDENGELFEYNPNNKESQRVQEALFHEKQTLIENCLFGVDINTNSVKICRLRLWIELLKNAYYKHTPNLAQGANTPLLRGAGGVLETLPNIDINIKCGNSLVSRFALDADLSQALKKSKWTIDSYRTAVQTYRNAESKEQKREMERLILSIKQNFSSEIRMNDPLKKRLDKLVSELYHRFTGTFLFEPEVPYGKKDEDGLEKKRKVAKEKLEKEIEEINQKFEAIKTNRVFENAFEWRFEFPEVLNENGDFVGFDVVIGNPPYGALFSENEKTFIKSNFQYCDYQFDIYMTFFERSYNLLKDFSQLCFIVPNTWLLNLKTPNIRKLLFSRFNTHNVRAYSFPVFEEAVVDTIIVSAEKKNDLSGSMRVQIIDKNGNIIENQFSKNELAVNYQSHVNIYLSDFASKIDFKFSKFSKLDNVAKITQGTKPFQKDKGKPKQDEKIMQEKPFVQSYKKDETFRPLLRGSLINKYVITWNNDYFISLGDWLAEPRYSANYDAPLKIVIRQTGSSLIATIDDRQFVVRDNLYTIISTNKEYSEYLILACLNSKLLNWYYQNIVNNEVGEALAQVKRGHLEILPMPKYNKIIFAAVESLIQQILDTKKVDNSADTTDLENQIDQLVYQLYDLTEEEIKIVEGA